MTVAENKGIKKGHRIWCINWIILQAHKIEWSLT